MRTTVITYQTPRGEKLNICAKCERRLTGQWPRSPRTGEEYCQVSRGRHQDVCHTCQEVTK